MILFGLHLPFVSRSYSENNIASVQRQQKGNYGLTDGGRRGDEGRSAAGLEGATLAGSIS